MNRTSKRPVRRFANGRRTFPGVEPLEGRALMTDSSAAYYPNGSEVIDVVYPDSTLYQYNNLGQSTNLGNNVTSASVAIDPNGNQIQDVVFNNGSLYEYDSTGAHYLGNNVSSASVAVSPTGGLVQGVVFNNGSLYQYDSTGAHYLGNNVKDVSEVFLHVLSSQEVQDVVFNNGNLYEYDALGAHYLGNNVNSDGVADYVTGNGTPSNPYHESLSHVIVFGNGADYHYDVAGPKLLGQLFTPTAPVITNFQQPDTVGTSITDTATVTGGDYPTGTVTFNLYSNANATGTPLFTDANVPLSGGTATSTGWTATAPGTAYWVVTYNGDSNNNAVTSGAASGPMTIALASPSITTVQQPASATVGSSIADKVTVTGGYKPTGTVTFKLYNNANGTGTPLFTDANVPLSGGSATSAGYKATAAGTDYWVATYNGNSNNNVVTSGAASGPVVVSPASAGSPSISTVQQPASAIVGTAIADKATVTGGSSPTGTVTFKLYNNANGTGTPLFTDANVPLSGGAATSAGYKAAAAGTDYWVATYNGDSNNNAVTSGAASGPVTITLGLQSAYSGQLFDTAGTGPPVPISSTIFLANILASNDGQGDNEAGTLTITNWDGAQINENFVGVFNTSGAIPEFNIRNAPSNTSTIFNFDFQINTNGSLYVEHNSDATYLLSGGFAVNDTSTGISDDLFGQSSDSASLTPS